MAGIRCNRCGGKVAVAFDGGGGNGKAAQPTGQMYQALYEQSRAQCRAMAAQAGEAETELQALRAKYAKAKRRLRRADDLEAAAAALRTAAADVTAELSNAARDLLPPPPQAQGRQRTVSFAGPPPGGAAAGLLAESLGAAAQRIAAISIPASLPAAAAAQASRESASLLHRAEEAERDLEDAASHFHSLTGRYRASLRKAKAEMAEARHVASRLESRLQAQAEELRACRAQQQADPTTIGSDLKPAGVPAAAAATQAATPPPRKAGQGGGGTSCRHLRRQPPRGVAEAVAAVAAEAAELADTSAPRRGPAQAGAVGGATGVPPRPDARCTAVPAAGWGVEEVECGCVEAEVRAVPRRGSRGGAGAAAGGAVRLEEEEEEVWACGGMGDVTVSSVGQAPEPRPAPQPQRRGGGGGGGGVEDLPCSVSSSSDTLGSGGAWFAGGAEGARRNSDWRQLRCSTQAMCVKQSINEDLLQRAGLASPIVAWGEGRGQGVGAEPHTRGSCTSVPRAPHFAWQADSPPHAQACGGEAMPHFSEESRLRFTADLIQLSKDERGVNHYSCFMSLKQKGRDLWKKTGIPRFARKLPISKQMRLIGIKFGSSVLSYYKLVRMLIVLNFLIFVLWVVWAIVPWFEHYDHHTYRIPVAPFSVLEEVTVNQALNITSLVPVTRNTITMHRTPDGLDIFRNVLGIPDPQVNEYSWWYYSGYSVKFKDYEMGSTYVLLCLGSFLLSLLLVVYLIGSGLAKGNQSAVSDSDTRLPLSLYAWDWEVQDPQAVEEKMLGCWMQVQAEYHNSMRAHDYFVDQSVRARRGQYDPWEVVTIVEIDGHDYWVQKEGGVRFSITDTNNIEVILKCGMKPRTIRRVCGTILSFLLCGGSVVGFYYALFYKESLDSSFPLTSSLVVKGINLCIPFIQRKIVKFEKIRNPQDAVKQEVIRVFVIKMAGLVFLFLSLKSLGEDSNDETCPEYLMGATYLQLMVTDFYVDLGMTTCKCFALQRLVEPPRKQDFVVSTEVINVLYRQCLMWMGSLYAPMVTFHAFVLLAVLFFVKTYCMFLMNKTPSQPMAEDGTGAFLYFMLLASMGVSGVPFFHFMKSEKMHCGPHLEPNCYDNDVMRGNCKTPLQYLNLFVDEAGMTDGTDWVFSSVILFFSCIALLVVAYLLSLSLWSGKAAAARRIDELNHEIKSLRQELREAKGIPPTSPGLNSTLGSELLKSIPLPPAMPPPGQLSPVVSPASPPSACPEDPQATLASVETAEAKVEGDGARCVSADDFEEKL